MSNAGAQFEEVADSPELNATPIDMSEEPENVPMQLQDTGLDELRPEAVGKEDPSYFLKKPLKSQRSDLIKQRKTLNKESQKPSLLQITCKH